MSIAYILNQLMRLKIKEYSNGEYKVRISEGSLKEYIEKLKELEVSFVIYDALKAVQNRDFLNNVESIDINNCENFDYIDNVEYIKKYK